jgi:hypothetical protein
MEMLQVTQTQILTLMPHLSSQHNQPKPVTRLQQLPSLLQTLPLLQLQPTLTLTKGQERRGMMLLLLLLLLPLQPPLLVSLCVCVCVCVCVSLEASLKALGFDLNTWETLALDRQAWRSNLTCGAHAAELQRTADAEDK